MGVGIPAAMELLSVPVVGNAFMAFMTMIGLTIIAGTAVQRWVAWKNELVGILNSNKILTRGDLMISLNFSIDINPQVFYIFVGLFVVYQIVQLIWLFKLKNKMKLEMFKDD